MRIFLARVLLLFLLVISNGTIEKTFASEELRSDFWERAFSRSVQTFRTSPLTDDWALSHFLPTAADWPPITAAHATCSRCDKYAAASRNKTKEETQGNYCAYEKISSQLNMRHAHNIVKRKIVPFGPQQGYDMIRSILTTEVMPNVLILLIADYVFVPVVKTSITYMSYMSGERKYPGKRIWGWKDAVMPQESADYYYVMTEDLSKILIYIPQHNTQRFKITRVAEHVLSEPTVRPLTQDVPIALSCMVDTIERHRISNSGRFWTQIDEIDGYGDSERDEGDD